MLYLEANTSRKKYYPFGMVMEGRSFSIQVKYRYGFNGKEKDDELGRDNYDFGARIYDGRIGRWFSNDPIIVENVINSSYEFVNGYPILAIDANGENQSVYLLSIELWNQLLFKSILNEISEKVTDETNYNQEYILKIRIYDDVEPEINKSKMDDPCNRSFNNTVNKKPKKHANLHYKNKTVLKVKSSTLLDLDISTNLVTNRTFTVNGSFATVNMDAFLQTDQFIIQDANGNVIYNSGIINGARTFTIVSPGTYTISIIPTIVTGTVDDASVNITQTTQKYKQVEKWRYSGRLFYKKRKVNKYIVSNKQGRLKTLKDGRTSGREKY